MYIYIYTYIYIYRKGERRLNNLNETLMRDGYNIREGYARRPAGDTRDRVPQRRRTLRFV